MTLNLTQHGVLAVQRRVTDRLRRLVAERKMRLDPYQPGWFGGRMELPTPGEPWELTISSRGETALVELTPAELDEFMATSPREVVTRKLGQALDEIRPQR